MLPSRILDKISPEPMTGCWIWKASLSRDGYGYIGFGGRVQKAHRVVYEFYKGEIPEGLEIDHLCRVRCCVNPDHLEPVTHRENMRRSPVFPQNTRKALAASHSARRSMTHCKRGHGLVENNIRINSNGSRVCIECERIKGRAWYSRHRVRILHKIRLLRLQAQGAN